MKKQDIILVLLIVAVLWLAVLTWFVVSQGNRLDLHEFWVKQALEMAK